MQHNLNSKVKSQAYYVSWWHIILCSQIRHYSHPLLLNINSRGYWRRRIRKCLIETISNGDIHTTLPHYDWTEIDIWLMNVPTIFQPKLQTDPVLDAFREYIYLSHSRPFCVTIFIWCNFFPDCPDDFHQLVTGCYYFSRSRGLNWTDSVIDCHRRQAQLIVIDNQLEQDALLHYFEDFSKCFNVTVVLHVQ